MAPPSGERPERPYTKGIHAEFWYPQGSRRDLVIGERLALNKCRDLRGSASTGLDLLVSPHLARLSTIPEGARRGREKSSK